MVFGVQSFALFYHGCHLYSGLLFFFFLFVLSGLAQSVSQFLIRFIHSLGFILQFYTHLCKRYMCVIGVFVLVSSIFVLNLHVLLLRIGCFGCCLKEKNFQTKSPSYARENRLTYMQHSKTNGQVNVSPEGVTKWKSTEKLSEPKINAE